MVRSNTNSSSNSGTLTQKELEAPVKGYQLQTVKDELVEIKGVLTEVKNNTSGVVSHAEMKVYVDDRIKEKLIPLNTFKNNINRLNWTILSLVIADIGYRILQGAQ
jgi:hypothetical protein